jgi:hypothetical protein
VADRDADDVFGPRVLPPAGRDEPVMEPGQLEAAQSRIKAMKKRYGRTG